MVKSIRYIWNGKKHVLKPYYDPIFTYYYHPILGLQYKCFFIDENLLS